MPVLILVLVYLYIICVKYVCVTGPAKIDYVCAKIIPSYIFANIFHSECSIPFPSVAEESPLNFAVVMKLLLR